MDTQETTVRLADLRQRFDRARAGKSLQNLGPGYAQLIARDLPPGTDATDDVVDPGRVDGIDGPSVKG